MASSLLLFCFTNAIFGVTARDLAPPTLTAHPSVITKTDSVTLNCQPPPSVSGPVSLCYFYTTDGQNWQNSNCSQSVRGSNLLMPNQTPPAQVKVQCYYVVEWGQAVSASYRSDQTPVTVHLQSMKPGISLQAFDTEVIIYCSPPPSATGCKCHLYFGESTQPHSTVNSAKKFCQFYVSKMDFVLNFHKVQRKVISCDVTLGNGPSPRSEQKDFTAPLDPEKTTDPQHETGSDPEAVPPEAVPSEAVPSEAAPPEAVPSEAVPPEAVPSEAVPPEAVPPEAVPPEAVPPEAVPSEAVPPEAVPSEAVPPEAVPSEAVPPEAVPSEAGPPKAVPPEKSRIIPLVIILTMCGVLVVCVISGSAFFCTKRRNAKHNKSSRYKAVEFVNTQNQPDKPSAHTVVNDDNFYSLITSVPSAHCSKGSAEVMDNQSKDVNESDTYHLYHTIEDVPGSRSVENVLYSSL